MDSVHHDGIYCEWQIIEVRNFQTGKVFKFGLKLWKILEGSWSTLHIQSLCAIRRPGGYLETDAADRAENLCQGNIIGNTLHCIISSAKQFREYEDMEYDLYRDHLVISVKEKFNCILCKSLGTLLIIITLSLKSWHLQVFYVRREIVARWI